MTVVCGTDLSERSRPGIAAAAAIAAAMRSPLWIAHVVGESFALLDPQAREQLEAAVQERLDSETAPAAGGVAVRHAMLEGSPHDALFALARAQHAELIVVSSRGHGAASRYRTGGTSTRIAADAPVPVLVVRDAEPFQAWARGERALRVVVGVDLGASAAAAVRWVRTLAAAGPCDVVFTHVYFENEALERYGLSGAPESHDLAEAERLLVRDVTALVGAFPGYGSHAVRVLAGTGAVADPLLGVARQERADLVVVGTHHRRGPARLWSVSSAVLHLAPMAVAVVPRPAAGPARERPERPRHVLVATDLSPDSNAAVAFALALVPRGGALHVLHVLPPREQSEERERADAAVAEKLRSLIPADAGARGVSVQVEVAHGQTVSTIRDLAERLGAELVCVTARHEGLARLAGSRVVELLRESRKPVLVLRPPPA
ncbi:universal stress protein [Anaeromyxobacter oryzisoli]|uniref:universal stress protein n=1 Tax=Anaeromyxobacter oryzisoli TaxID=2925408 RepID=UPI001F59EDD5|nr:universal stress protein [Anaeromyxobacter sp. SG63]